MKAEDQLKMKQWLFSLVIITFLFLGTRFLFPTDTGNFIDPTNAFSYLASMLILGILLKINYSKGLFIFDLFLGLLLVSIFNFTQGFMPVLLVVLVQKLFKML